MGGPPSPPHTGTGMKVGRGWHPVTEKYFIHMPKLLSNGTLSLSRRTKRGTLSKIDGFPNKKVSKHFQEALLSLLKSKRLPDLSDLPDEERQFLYKLLAITAPPQLVRTDGGLTERQKERIEEAKKEIKARTIMKNKEFRYPAYLQRLTLLVGEALAGNHNNPELMKEGTRILNTLVRAGVISKDEAERVAEKLR
jgi:hypothetical protein